MQRNIPPSIDQTIVTEVLQRSDVCFYWNMMHEQLTASKLTASIGDKLHSTVPIRERRFIEGQNNHSTHSNQSRKSLVSPPSKLRGNKKREKKESASEEKITKPQKSNTKKREPRDTGSSPVRTFVICVVAIVWAMVIITYPFFQNPLILTAVTTAFGGVLAYLLGNNPFGSKKQ